MFSGNYSYSIMITYMHTALRFQEYLSNMNNLHTVTWFQVFIFNIHNFSADLSDT